jgi:hypothetical protein
MNRQDLEAAVAAHPFLIGMTQHHIRLLADCAMQSHFEQGQIIFREGDTANRFYLIEQGEVVLESSMAGTEPVVIDTRTRRRIARLVVALRAVRVAFQRTRHSADKGDLLLRHCAARILRT